MKKSFNVKKFDNENSEEYYILRDKISVEFGIIRNQSFNDNKSIFILSKKGIFSQKIIGYAIIFDCTNINEKTAFNISLINRISVDTIKEPCILISDFMISKWYRRKKLGSDFFDYIKNNYYERKDFLLVPDGDGKKFWPKVGFTSLNGFKVMKYHSRCSL